MYCNQCGKEILEGSRFCAECGSPVAKRNEKPYITAYDELIDADSDLLNSQQTIATEVKLNINNDNENYQSFYSNQQKDIKKLTSTIAFDKKGMLITIMICVGSLGMAFLPFVLKSKILIGICVCIFFGMMYLFSLLFHEFVETKKELILAQSDYFSYQKIVEEKKELERKRRLDEEKIKKENEERRAAYMAKGIPTCPKCGSESIATINRGYSLVWGMIGSGKPVNVCQMCGHKWRIGK